MFFNNNDKPINVLIVSENIYHQHGAKCLMREFYPNSHTIHFDCLDEREFLDYTYECFDKTFQRDYSFVFSGRHAQHIISMNLKNSLTPLFSLNDSLERIRDKLKHRGFYGYTDIPSLHRRPKLSKREHYLYELMMLGHNDDKIAKLMCISKKTISSHRRNVLKKLGHENKNKMYLHELTLY